MNTRKRTQGPPKRKVISSTSKKAIGRPKALELPSTSKYIFETRKRCLKPHKCKPGCCVPHPSKKRRKGHTEEHQDGPTAVEVPDQATSSVYSGDSVSNCGEDLKDEVWKSDEARRQQLIFFLNMKVSLQYEEDEKERYGGSWSKSRTAEKEGLERRIAEKPGVSWPKLRNPYCTSTKTNRRKQIPEPPVKPPIKHKFKSWYQDGRKSESEMYPVSMAPVSPEPPMIHWAETTMNYRVEDGKFLVHYPYLGEDVVDQDFENELYESYGGVDHKSLQQTKMPDEVFFQTIVKYEKRLAARQNQLLPIHGTASLMKQYVLDVFIPCRFIFADMATAFPFLGFPFELEQRFAKLLKANQKNLPEDEKNAPTEEGLKLAIKAKQKQNLHAIEKNFCRRCLLYCCLTHDEDDHVDPKYINYTKLEDEPKPEIKCGHDDCIKITGVNPIEGNQFPDWTPEEKTLCNVLMKRLKEDYCYMSAIMVTKTCKEVYNYCYEISRHVIDWVEERSDKGSPIKSIASATSHSSSDEEEEEKEDGFKTQEARIEVRKNGKLKFIPKNWSSGDDCPHYIPCLHLDGGYCDEKSNCSCFNRGGHCEKYCSCAADCIRRFKGCKCKTDCSTSSCPCYKANRECDPSLCRSCGSENKVPVTGKCVNVGILYQWEKKIVLKKSKVAGWGGFTPCDIKKWELIAEYRGELISHAESSRRALLYDRIQHTYLFALNEDLVIDATRVGSKVRFLNSSTKPNCVPKIMMVNGDHRIGIYADKFIKAGEELFFDYEHVIKKTIKNKRKKNKGKTKVA